MTATYASRRACGLASGIASFRPWKFVPTRREGVLLGFCFVEILEIRSDSIRGGEISRDFAMRWLRVGVFGSVSA